MKKLTRTSLLALMTIAAMAGLCANAAEVKENGLGGKVFDMFTKYAKSNLDMTISMPQGYTVTKYCIDAFWQPILSESGGDGCAKVDETSTRCLPQSYGYVLEAADGESAIIMPRLGDIAMGEASHRDGTDIYMELLAHYNDCMGTRLRLDDTTLPMLRQMLLTDNSLCGKFNADTVKVAAIPMKTPFEGKFTQCVGIYLLKGGHTKTYIKLLLTDKSRNDERRYIDLIAQNVKFGSKKELLNMLDNRSNWWKFANDVAKLEKQYANQ